MNDEAAVELEPAIYGAIKAYCSRGDELAAIKSYEDAIAQYNQAWLLVPDPKNKWTAATWILAAIADAAFLGGYKNSAIEALQYVMMCPGSDWQSVFAPPLWPSPVRCRRSGPRRRRVDAGLYGGGTGNLRFRRPAVFCISSDTSENLKTRCWILADEQ